MKGSEDEDSKLDNTLEERNLQKLMKKKICSNTLGLSRHGEEELELTGEYGK
jgi:hypothetical protein